MADISALLQNGATLEQILEALRADFTTTVGGFKAESGGLYDEAMKAIRGYYDQATEDAGDSFQERYGFLEDNLDNLGLNFADSELANQWDADQTYLQESADQAFANDMAWFEKMKAADPGIYEAILAEAAFLQAMGGASSTAVGGGGSGGGGRSGGRGGGGSSSSSSEAGDWDETTSVTLRNDFERDFPGFIEAVNAGQLGENPWTDDQWAYFTDLIDANTEPKDMLQQIVQDTQSSNAAAEAARGLLANLATDSATTASIARPTGNPGEFTWEQRELPAIDRQVLEQASSPFADAVTNYGGNREGFLRRALQTEGVMRATPEELEEELDNILVQKGYGEDRRLLEEAARQTISDDVDFGGEAEQIRRFLRYWDPIQGWVNTEQTADEYWRSQNKEKDLPGPDPIEALDPNDPLGVLSQPLNTTGANAFGKPLSLGAVANPPEPGVNAYGRTQDQINAAFAETPSGQRFQNAQTALRFAAAKQAEKRAREERLAREAAERQRQAQAAAAANSRRSNTRPTATRSNPAPRNTGTFGQSVPGIPYTVAAPKPKPKPKRRSSTPRGFDPRVSGPGGTSL